MIERYGSGIRRIIDCFKEYGLPRPVFEEIGSGFRVTIFKGYESIDSVKNGSGSREIYRIPPNKNETTPHEILPYPPIKDGITTHKTDDTPPKKSLRLRILQLLAGNPALSQKEAAERLGISFDTAKEYFTKLKKEGKIKRVGSKKGGTWQLLNR